MNREVNRPSAFYDIFDSPVGPVYLVFSGRYLSGISFRKPSGIPFKKGTAPAGFIEELTLYFKGVKGDFSQKTRFLTGTDFEKEVWLSVRKIPFGETMTYKQVAEKIGRPGAARAVGRALSKNPIPIVIPCHRVIESDGSIGGYSSGIKTKIRLLELEYYSRLDKPFR